MNDKIVRIRRRCKGSLVLVYGAIAVYAAVIIASVVNLIATALTATGKLSVVLEEGRWSYQNLLNNSWYTVCQEYLPTYHQVFNAKTFILTHMITNIVANYVPILLFLICICRMIRKVTRSYTPFGETIPKMLHQAGTIMILYGVFGQLVIQVAMSTIVFHFLNIMNPLRMSYVLVGLLLYIMADIFQYGSWLQQEQDAVL